MGDMSEQVVEVRRVKVVPLRQGDEPRLKELLERAAVDDHMVLGPSHVVMKGEQVVGYLSLGTVPMLNVWMDSKQVSAGESVRVLEVAEALLADKGARMVVCPCAENSPYKPHMARLGFMELGATVVHLKKLG